jgi:hypothetical protein
VSSTGPKQAIYESAEVAQAPVIHTGLSWSTWRKGCAASRSYPPGRI